MSQQNSQTDSKTRGASFAAMLSVLSVFIATGVTSVFAADYQQGEIIVKYKEDAIRTRAVMNQMYVSGGVKHVKRYSGLMRGVEHLVLADNVKVEDAIAEFSRSGMVEYAQPNYILHTFPTMNLSSNQIDYQAADTTSVPCAFPGAPYPAGCVDASASVTRPALQAAPADVNPPQADPGMSKLYGMTKIGATDAWKIHRGDKRFIVAVIDTGVDYNHEDLSFNMWRNAAPSDKQDIVGYDFTHNDGLPFDDNKHGTHTSGTVGAVGGNGRGVSGVSQRVSIMGLKFLTGQGSGTTADAIRAIDYAITHGAKVLSNSWGGQGDDGNKALFDAVERARAKDVLFVAAAGNDGENNDGSNPSYPAAFTNDNLIAVAATDSNDKMASFSNYGKKTVHVAAPGVNIYSTVPGNRYEQLSGTSMACPHVAGAAALIWSKNPSMNYKQVKDLLMSTVDVLPSLQGKTVTGGRINVAKALAHRR